MTDATRRAHASPLLNVPHTCPKWQVGEGSATSVTRALSVCYNWTGLTLRGWTHNESLCESVQHVAALPTTSAPRSNQSAPPLLVRRRVEPCRGLPLGEVLTRAGMRRVDFLSLTSGTELGNSASYGLERAFPPPTMRAQSGTLRCVPTVYPPCAHRVTTA